MMLNKTQCVYFSIWSDKISRAQLSSPSYPEESLCAYSETSRESVDIDESQTVEDPSISGVGFSRARASVSVSARRASRARPHADSRAPKGTTRIHLFVCVHPLLDDRVVSRRVARARTHG